MHRLLTAALLLLLAGAAPAFAYDTPADLMKAIYSHYTDAKFDWDSFDEATVRSKALNMLFDKDAKEANGEVGRIDFDPYVDGQDYEITKLKIGAPTVKGDTATVEVKFNNFEMEEDMVFTLVKEADGWKIDDVNSKGGADPYDLKDIMSAPLAQ
jgi:hypothetical protein